MLHKIWKRRRTIQWTMKEFVIKINDETNIADSTYVSFSISSVFIEFVPKLDQWMIGELIEHKDCFEQRHNRSAEKDANDTSNVCNQRQRRHRVHLHHSFASGIHAFYRNQYLSEGKDAEFSKENAEASGEACVVRLLEENLTEWDVLREFTLATWRQTFERTCAIRCFLLVPTNLESREM